MQAPSTDAPGAPIHLAISIFFWSHQQPTSFSFVFFLATKEIRVGGDVEEGTGKFMIDTFAMPGSTVRCSLELYFQIPHYPLTQIHHPEDWHARSSQRRSNGFETPQDNQDHPFWLTARSGDPSRFPSRALYFNVSYLLAISIKAFRRILPDPKTDLQASLTQPWLLRLGNTHRRV